MGLRLIAPDGVSLTRIHKLSDYHRLCHAQEGKGELNLAESLGKPRTRQFQVSYLWPRSELLL